MNESGGTTHGEGTVIEPIVGATLEEVRVAVIRKGGVEVVR